jgi:hypothetical protein
MQTGPVAGRGRLPGDHLETIMGKVTGFLEIERRDRAYEKTELRLKSFKEFVLPLPAEELNRQAARCMDCGIPFCHSGCPVIGSIAPSPSWRFLWHWGHVDPILVHV